MIESYAADGGRTANHALQVRGAGASAGAAAATVGGRAPVYPCSLPEGQQRNAVKLQRLEHLIRIREDFL